MWPVFSVKLIRISVSEMNQELCKVEKHVTHIMFFLFKNWYSWSWCMTSFTPWWGHICLLASKQLYSSVLLSMPSIPFDSLEGVTSVSGILGSWSSDPGLSCGTGILLSLPFATDQKIVYSQVCAPSGWVSLPIRHKTFPSLSACQLQLYNTVGETLPKLVSPLD